MRGGYLTGAGWQEYQEAKAIAGIQLPEGMVESQRLPAQTFAPLLSGPNLISCLKPEGWRMKYLANSLSLVVLHHSPGAGDYINLVS